LPARSSGPNNRFDPSPTADVRGSRGFAEAVLRAPTAHAYDGE
jgi:hypothetical protein